jgi:hypothetical protein
VTAGKSEFGFKSGPTGLPDKPINALTASERLRLGYTAEAVDPMAKATRENWLGGKRK